MGHGKGGCSARCVLMFNSLFLVAGIGIMVLGGLCTWGYGTLTNTFEVFKYVKTVLQDPNVKQYLIGLNVEDILEPFGIAILVIGAVICIVAGVGFLGVCKKSKPLLVIYIIIVVVIGAAQICSLVALYGYEDTLSGHFKSQWKSTITHYYSGVNATGTTKGAISAFWEGTNRFFNCCGVYNYTDFQAATNWDRSYVISGTNVTLETPFSCCKYDQAFPMGDPISPSSCATVPATATSNYRTNCWNQISSWIFGNMTVMVVIIGVIVFEFMLVIAAICAVKSFASEMA